MPKPFYTGFVKEYFLGNISFMSVRIHLNSYSYMVSRIATHYLHAVNKGLKHFYIVLISQLKLLCFMVYQLLISICCQMLFIYMIFELIVDR